MAIGVANYDQTQLLDIVGQDESLILTVENFDALKTYSQIVSDKICGDRSKRKGVG